MADDYFDKTHLMSVHLDIRSRMDLRALAEGFGRSVRIVYSERVNGIYETRVMLSRYKEFPEPTISALCSAVRRLPKPARVLWNRALSRTFDVGIEAAVRSTCWFALAPKTLKALVELGGRVVVTVYGPEEAKRREEAHRGSRRSKAPASLRRAGNR